MIKVMETAPHTSNFRCPHCDASKAFTSYAFAGTHGPYACEMCGKYYEVDITQHYYTKKVSIKNAQKNWEWLDE